MATPVSSSTPYCTAADLVQRYDWRTIMQLMGDHQGKSNPMRNTLSDTTTVEGSNLYTILMDCSGEVEAAVGNAGKYTPTALQELTGASESHLKRLVADLAIWRCYQRRPDWQMPVPDSALAARQLLNAIASGENVLGLQENIDAGILDLTRDTPEVVDSRNLSPRIAWPMVGRRGNQYPLQ